MSLDAKELQLVQSNLTSWLLSFESSTDKTRKAQMHKKLAKCYDQAISNARKASRQALGYQMLNNSLLSQAHTIEASKWRSVADEVLRVIELVNEDSNSAK